MKRQISTALCVMIAAACALCCSGIRRDILQDGRAFFSGPATLVPEQETLKGRVLDSITSKGIAGAQVEMKNANLGVGYHKATAASDGSFVIDDYIPQVRYHIAVSAPGYVPHRGYLQSNTTIYLDPQAVVRGTVRDSAGVPLPGVEVKLRSGAGRGGNNDSGEGGEGRGGHSCTTDARGGYRFDQLRSGAYLITFRKSGHIEETARLGSVLRGGELDLPMVLYRTASVSGKVLIQGTGAPAVNLTVSLKAQGVQYSASTFQDGSYSIDDVRPGRYDLYIQHPGFHQLRKGPVTVTEGQRMRGMDWQVKAKEPALSVYAYRYTFSPVNKIEFNLRTFRLEKVRVRIYRVPPSVLSHGRGDPNTMSPSARGFHTVKEWDQPVKDFQPFQWQYGTMEMSGPLATGGYCVEVSASDRLFDRKFFTVTSVGVVVKRSQRTVLAYVTNLVNNDPVRGAKVVLFDNTPAKERQRLSARPVNPPQRIEDLPLRVLHRGETGSDGIYRHGIESSRHLSVLVVGGDGSYAFCNTGSPDVFDRELNKVMAYTDRPVYRVGDTVQFKLMGKRRDDRSVPIAGRKLYIMILDATGGIVKRGNVTLDDWGSAKGSIQLSGEPRLGRWDIRAGLNPKSLAGVGHFYVEQYRKPEFTVAIEPSKKFFVNNETAEFRVTTKYLFGAPLRNAVVKYRFYESRLRDTDTTYWWEADYGGGQSYNRIRLEGDKTTDENGTAVLRLECKNLPYDREITCEATVTDSSNVSITSRKGVRVGRGEYYIKIEPARTFFVNKDVNRVTLRTVDHAGRPVREKVDLKVYRYIWRPLQMVYVHESRPVYEKRVETDARGKFLLTLPEVAATGEYDIVAGGSDRFGNLISASRVVWIYAGPGGTLASRLKNLELSVDRTRLDGPGEITCLVKSRFPDATVCLTLEGRDVYEARVVRLKGHMATVNFTIKDAYAPNLYVSAMAQVNRGLYTAKADVALPKGDTKLLIAIETDKETYGPGEKATVTLRARDEKGNPVPADISLGCVDEGIYSVRPDHTPSLMDYFYSRLANLVLTAYSFPVTLLAGAIKDVIEQVRERFRDTAFWQPDIRTDARGVAVVSFDLPDNLTTWRLTARGHDRHGRVGEAVKKVLATQEMVARIGRPRFFIEGDRVGIIGIVNSNSPRGLERVTAEMKVNDKTVAPDQAIALSLPPFGTARQFYTVAVPESLKEMVLFFKAGADAKARDALRIAVPVERRGTPYSLFAPGDLDTNRTVALSPLGDTDDFEYRPESLRITVNPGPLQRMLRAARWLRGYRYGCVEQLLSKTVPVMALKRLLSNRGMSQYLKDDKLEERLGRALRRIESAQNADGTWGWFPSGEANMDVTAYVLQNFKTVSDFGFRRDENSVRRGIEAVKRGARNGMINPDSRAYYLYVESLWNVGDLDTTRAIAAMKDQNPYRLAMLLRTLTQLKRSGRIRPEEYTTLASSCAERLRSMMRRDGRGVFWEATADQAYSWAGGNTEVSAAVLSALLESGDTSAIPAQLASSLSRRGYMEAWRSTRETAAAMMALCGYLGKAQGQLSPSGSVRFSLNGKDLGTLQYGGSRDPSDLTRVIPLGDMKAEKYSVTADGGGSGVSFDCVMEGHLYFARKGILSLFSSEEGGIRSLENGVSLTRTFHSIARVRDANNREYMVPQRISEKGRIKVGDEVMVKVRFRAQDDFSYLVVEDYLPSGFEVVKTDAYGGGGDYAHQERWDDRMLFFFSKVRKGTIYDVAYIMRAELPGSFFVKPARAECMYEPSVQGWSRASGFQVHEK
ncbi:MAG: carboxypeptidase regulatory-like domain-containing protein [Spirochaetes bacterium]|nr:carboxypeptidase regulatory-like domain-containing protein [Spirochaetota bacterium]